MGPECSEAKKNDASKQLKFAIDSGKKSNKIRSKLYHQTEQITHWSPRHFSYLNSVPFSFGGYIDQF